MGRTKFPCPCCPNTRMLLSQCIYNPDIRILVAHDSYLPYFHWGIQISPLLLIPLDKPTQFVDGSLIFFTWKEKTLVPTVLKEGNSKNSTMKGGGLFLRPVYEPTARDLNFLPSHFICRWDHLLLHETAQISITLLQLYSLRRWVAWTDRFLCLSGKRPCDFIQ